jgi:phosphoribosylamine---glycine ligase
VRILVIGSGGREHALAWKLSQSTFHHNVCCAPGNPGMAAVAECHPARDPAGYLTAANTADADLTIVGPEVPLVAGVVDLFQANGRVILGPDAAAARIEGSKTFAKELMRELNIPTAHFRAVTSRADARAALAEFTFPVVVKADGLAAGKGVIIAQDRTEALEAIDALGDSLVIEEFLQGEEASFIALCDGRDAVPLEATQDHKQINDGDTGPNTGGMGAYCDGRILSSAQVDTVMDQVIRPVIARIGFKGFLYAGLMIAPDGSAKVLEFNCRLGDPETQPLMHRIDGDPAELFLAAARGSLAGAQMSWKREPSVCVVISASGYPGTPRAGDLISGIADAELLGASVFHAGTRQAAHGIETSGGRVLGVTSRGDRLDDAIANTYAAVAKIHFEGMHYRSDIGQKGLNRWA